MSREGAIKIEGVVVDAVNDRLYRVEFANGHRVLGHLPRSGEMIDSRAGVSPATQMIDDRGRDACPALGKRRLFSVGDKVTVEMSPFDFSKGRICLENFI